VSASSEVLATTPQAKEAAEKVPRIVIPSEARNLPSLEAQLEERFFGEEHASE
jgi:hypothetical protein